MNRLWIRVSWLRSARWSRRRAFHKRPSGSVSRSPRSACRSGRSRSGSASSSLDRSGRRVEPTEAGQRLYRNAQRVLAAEEQLLDELTGGRAHRGPLRARRLDRARRLGRADPARRARGARTRTSASRSPSPTRTASSSSSPTARSSSASSGSRAATARSCSSRSSATRSCSRCPPGHRFAGKTISLDDLREETLILMQEGAGVREAIEDELRAVGVRLRDFGARLELGLQESVRTAVEAGYRRHVHLAVGDRGRARGRHAHRGARRGPRAVARDLPRTRGRPHARRARRRRSSISRANASRDRSLGPRRAARTSLGGRRAFLLATERWDAPVDVAGRWSELPTDAAIDVGDAEVLLALGGGSTIDTAKRVSARDGTAAGLGADDVLRLGVDRRTSACATRSGACAAAEAARTTRRSSTTST